MLTAEHEYVSMKGDFILKGSKPQRFLFLSLDIRQMSFFGHRRYFLMFFWVCVSV